MGHENKLYNSNGQSQLGKPNQAHSQFTSTPRDAASKPMKRGAAPETVLVVTKSSRIARAVQTALRSQNISVVSASPNQTAESIIDHSPIAIIVDESVCERESEFLQHIRILSDAPILLITDAPSNRKLAAALDAGADAFIVVPFSSNLLGAQLRALVRRSSISVGASEPIVTCGDIEIDLQHRRVTKGGENIHLTRTEYRILEFLAANANKVVTPEMIQKHVWGTVYPADEKTLRVHIANLRRKLEPCPSSPRYILTQRGIGYILVANQENRRPMERKPLTDLPNKPSQHEPATN